MLPEPFTAKGTKDSSNQALCLHLPGRRGCYEPYTAHWLGTAGGGLARPKSPIKQGHRQGFAGQRATEGRKSLLVKGLGALTFRIGIEHTDGESLVSV
jgi:hypothetical protein